jgi:DNA repair protein RecO (recombination protein O)
MQWRDTGFVLVARRHGESALIADLLTRDHGRHAGLVRGGQSPRVRAILQPGNEVAAVWRGRLDEHLGTITCELVRAHAARLLDDAGRLAGLTSAAALVTGALPEREPQADVFVSFARLIEALDSSIDWPVHYVKWEVELLGALGFGLDLSRCAVSGVAVDLAYVSPRTGRAVSRAAGLPYHDKLLALPEFLWRDTPADETQLRLGLTLTGHFLAHHVFAPHNRSLPASRLRLAERVRRAAAAGQHPPDRTPSPTQPCELFRIAGEGAERCETVRVNGSNDAFRRDPQC